MADLDQRIHDLPDFNIIAQHHHDLATEMSKCNNIPALNGGERIVEALRVLTTEFREFRAEIRNALRATDNNNIARILNSQINTPDADLHPLHSIETGEPIPNFPNTPADISNLDAASLNTILRALGADVTGRPEVKRTRLRKFVGLRPLPV